jgi:hypothetical protein
MLAASHALIGAAVAKMIPNPYLAVPVNIILHFAGDLFPHWDLHTRESKRSKLKVIVFSLTDAFLGYLVGFLIFGQLVSPLYLMAMMLVAQLPDWIEAPYRIFDWNFPPFSTVKKLQSRLHYKLGLPWGLIGQILVVIVFIAVAQALDT